MKRQPIEKNVWKRFSRAQIPSGMYRGILYQHINDPTRWMWKNFEFQAESPQMAIAMLLFQQVGPGKVMDSPGTKLSYFQRKAGRERR